MQTLWRARILAAAALCLGGIIYSPVEALGQSVTGSNPSTNEVATGNTRQMTEGHSSEIVPTNAVLQVIEWKQRTADEPNSKDATFVGWKAHILTVKKESEGVYVITAEIRPDLASKNGGVMWTQSSITERWIADRGQGLRFDRVLRKAGGVLLKD